MAGNRHWLLAACVAALIAGCGGGGGSGSDEPPTDAAPPGTVDAAGARLDGPDGSRVDVPKDALAAAVRVVIAKDATAAPGLAANSGFRLVSNVYTITPHGQSFAKPVTVTLPLDADRLAATGQLVLLKAQPGGEWVVHTAVRRTGGLASVDVRDFSIFALAQRSAEPFRFSLVVTGTAPDLTVRYAFTGQRPVCTRGLVVQTVFRYEWLIDQGERITGAFGQTQWVGSVTTRLLDQQVLAVPGGVAGAEVGHKVTQPMLPPQSGTSTYDARYIQRWTPYVEGRLVCDGEVLSVTDAGTTLTPQTWTYRSENMPELAGHTGPVALLDDIAPVQASVGARSSSAATVQLRSELWGQSLLQNARWQLSRDAGATWSALATADQIAAASPPAGVGQTGNIAINGQFRLGATLPDLPLAYNGALIRLRACVDASLGTPACAQGAPRALTVSAATVAPAVTREPASTVVVAGAGATFSVVTSGTPPPALQWQRADGGGWTDIAGATGAAYTLAATTAGDDGARFRVVATNSAGSVASDAATLNVVDQAAAPALVVQSGSLTVAAGGSAVFAAQVSGTAPLSYQWRRNGTPITGANGPILRIDGVGDAHAGDYTLEVSNPAGRVVGAAQVLTVTEGAGAPTAPTITRAPSALTVTEGNGATFGVGAAGSGPLAFQWRKNGSDIAGATAATYTLAAVAGADGGSYSVRVSNAAGSVVSAAATLTVTAAPPVPPPAQPPSIVTPPGTVVVAPGMGATLAATVAGTGPFTYEWLRNGVVVPGQSAVVYTIAAASSLDVGSYVLRVSNAVGTVSSTAGQVILLGAPAITVPPADTTAAEGATASFGVAAAGTAPQYQWTRNGVAIEGATSASYTTPALALADSGAVYAVIVYNGAGLVTSGGAVLTVVEPPAVLNVSGKLAIGRLHTCAVTAADEAACWGENSSGQIGTGNTVTVFAPFVWTLPEPVRSVAAGFAMSCALTATTGRVFCSGGLVNAQVPTEVPGLTGVTALAAGAVHACALKADGSVWCWGGGNQYELGNGNNVGGFTPVQVLADPGVPLAGVVAIDSTERHTCAVVDIGEGAVHCWGANNYHQLGYDPFSGYAGEPGFARAVPGLSNVSQVVAGSGHTCVVMTLDSSVRCWGLNNWGQLGIGTTHNLTEPQPPTAVPGLSGVGQLAAGIIDTCALLLDGTVRCWGSGFLGNSYTEYQTSPVAVAGLSDVIAVDAGDIHTCVLRNGGGLQCWGSNIHGAYGNGTNVSSETPVAAGGGVAWWQP
jgi:alpha-tubulin suppressor-like RCC1 family protein